MKFLIIPAPLVVVWVDNQCVTEDLTPLTIRDLRTIVADVVRSLREDNHRDTDKEELNVPTLSG